MLGAWRCEHRPDPVAPRRPAALASLCRTVDLLRAELVVAEDALTTLEAVVAAPAGEPTLLTVEEAAEALRVSRSRVFEFLASGELNGVMLGKRRLVPRRSLDALLGRIGA